METFEELVPLWHTVARARGVAEQVRLAHREVSKSVPSQTAESISEAPTRGPGPDWRQLRRTVKGWPDAARRETKLSTECGTQPPCRWARRG